MVDPQQIHPYIMSAAKLYQKKLEREEYKSLCKEVCKLRSVIYSTNSLAL